MTIFAFIAKPPTATVSQSALGTKSLLYYYREKGAVKEIKDNVAYYKWLEIMGNASDKRKRRPSKCCWGEERKEMAAAASTSTAKVLTDKRQR